MTANRPTTVRHRGRCTRTLIAEATQHPDSKRETPLQEHKRPQEPGRPTAPQDPHSSTASAPRNMKLAPSSSHSSVLGDVLRAPVTPHHSDQTGMHATTTTTTADDVEQKPVWNRRDTTSAAIEEERHSPVPLWESETPSNHGNPHTGAGSTSRTLLNAGSGAFYTLLYWYQCNTTTTNQPTQHRGSGTSAIPRSSRVERRGGAS